MSCRSGDGGLRLSGRYLLILMSSLTTWDVWYRGGGGRTGAYETPGCIYPLLTCPAFLVLSDTVFLMREGSNACSHHCWRAQWQWMRTEHKMHAGRALTPQLVRSNHCDNRLPQQRSASLFRSQGGPAVIQGCAEKKGFTVP